VGKGRAFDAVRRLNDWFQLRDCSSRQPLRFADQGVLFASEESAKCLRYDIGTCLGPCSGLCTRTEYTAKVRAAQRFLDGKDTTILDILTKQMSAAAAELRFEQAMAARDRLQSLAWLSDRLAFLRGARRANSFVYPLETPSGTVWYLIHHGEVQGAIRAPVTAEDRQAATQSIHAAFATVAPPGGVDDQCVDSVLLVTSWFRRHPEEKAKLLTMTAALTLCQEPPRSVSKRVAV
jgi:excinuclease ABC subunit C